MVRAKSEQVTVTVPSGQFGNRTPDPITVKFAKATRVNVTNQTEDFMTAIMVDIAQSGMSISKFVNTAMSAALTTAYEGTLTKVSERGASGRKVKIAKTGVEIAEKDAKNTLLAIFMLQQKQKDGLTLNAVEKKELDALQKQMGF